MPSFSCLMIFAIFQTIQKFKGMFCQISCCGCMLNAEMLLHVILIAQFIAVCLLI